MASEQKTNLQTGGNRASVKLERSEFWREIGSDFDRGVEKYSEKSDMTSTSIIAVAIVDVFSFDRLTSLFIGPAGSDPSFHVSPRDVVRYVWRRKLQLTVWVGILAALIFSAASTFRIYSPSPPVIRSHVAQRKNGLPAYHKIGPGDLRAFTGTEVVDGAPIGRYTLKPITDKRAVKEEDLLDEHLNAEMNGRSILFLPASVSSFSSSVEPNSKVTIVVSWPEPNAGTDVVSDVILLGVERRPDSVTLAVGVTTDQFNKIRVRLADSKFHVAK